MVVLFCKSKDADDYMQSRIIKVILCRAGVGVGANWAIPLGPHPERGSLVPLLG